MSKVYTDAFGLPLEEGDEVVWVSIHSRSSIHKVKGYVTGFTENRIKFSKDPDVPIAHTVKGSSLIKMNY